MNVNTENGEIKESSNAYQNIAWFGGSFSPPTKMHVNVIIEIAKALISRTDEGRISSVCIVPVSNKYDKGSVQMPCITPAERKVLCDAFLAGVKQVWSDDQSIGDKSKIDFHLLTYEMDNDTPTPTIASLEILKSFPESSGSTIYLSQGQDNMLSIFRRKWVRSNELLANNFIMFPRGNDPNLYGEMMGALTAPQSDSKEGKFPPLNQEEAENLLSNRLIIVGQGFEDTTSSSLVRKVLRGEQQGDLGDLLHPFVLQALTYLHGQRSDIYTNGCEDIPSKRTATASGGKRKSRKSRKSRNSKRKTNRKQAHKRK